MQLTRNKSFGDIKSSGDPILVTAVLDRLREEMISGVNGGSSESEQGNTEVGQFNSALTMQDGRSS